ncbi:sugar-binding transcriptional regulator [Labedella populi]|uniref:sugar-binding transcriptional regulator n=1 Tax=Labedella populi TaxID=2498850 RepID=UPI00140C71C2|nr:sugar-binding domain-containing protein [Labedella populi]
MTENLLDAAVVARRFYLDRRQKSEIAAELGLSRFKVARLLDAAHAAGIVHIRIDVPDDVDTELADVLERRFGLRRVIVVREAEMPGADRRTATPLHAVGLAAARFLSAHLRPDDVVGLSWGASVAHVVDALDDVHLAEVVQLVGGVTPAPLGERSPGRPARSGRDLVEELARRTGATAVPLHSPLVLASARTAALLREDPSVALTALRFPAVTTAIVGIGSWQPPSSSLLDLVGPDDRRELWHGRATADVCGIVLDAAGRAVRSSLSERTIGVSLEQLRSVPTVVAVAGGATKATAISSVLHSGLIDVLVTDEAAARAIAHPGENSTGTRDSG